MKWNKKWRKRGRVLLVFCLAVFLAFGPLFTVWTERVGATEEENGLGSVTDSTEAPGMIVARETPAPASTPEPEATPVPASEETATPVPEPEVTATPAFEPETTETSVPEDAAEETAKVQESSKAEEDGEKSTGIVPKDPVVAPVGLVPEDESEGASEGTLDFYEESTKEKEVEITEALAAGDLIEIKFSTGADVSLCDFITEADGTFYAQAGGRCKVTPSVGQTVYDFRIQKIDSTYTETSPPDETSYPNVVSIVHNKDGSKEWDMPASIETGKCLYISWNQGAIGTAASDGSVYSIEADQTSAVNGQTWYVVNTQNGSITGSWPQIKTVSPYQIWDSNGGSWSSQATIATTSGQGETNFTLMDSDNGRIYNLPITYAVDADDPAISVTGGSGAAWTNQDVTCTVTASDSYSGIPENGGVYWTTDWQSKYGAIAGTETKFKNLPITKTTGDASGVGDNTYTVTFAEECDVNLNGMLEAKDGVNHTAAFQQDMRIRIDKTAPSLLAYDETNGYQEFQDGDTFSSGLKLQVQEPVQPIAPLTGASSATPEPATHSSSGISQVRVECDGKDTKTYQGNELQIQSNSWCSYFDFSIPMEEEVCVYKITVTDGAGNVCSRSNITVNAYRQEVSAVVTGETTGTYNHALPIQVKVNNTNASDSITLYADQIAVSGDDSSVFEISSGGTNESIAAGGTYDNLTVTVREGTAVGTYTGTLTIPYHSNKDQMDKILTVPIQARIQADPSAPSASPPATPGPSATPEPSVTPEPPSTSKPSSSPESSATPKPSPSGDNKDEKISGSGKYKLKKGVAYRLGKGTWRVSGDDVRYAGNTTFYISGGSGEYELSKE